VASRAQQFEAISGIVHFGLGNLQGVVIMKKLLIGSFVALTMGGSAAMAADMPLKAPPPVAVFSWTGCYVGIEGGGAWGRSKHARSLTTNPAFVGLDFTPWFDVSGGLAGVEYGCNQQFGGNWVFGIEGDISWTNKKGSSFDTGPGGTATFSSETKEKWISTSRARIGWAWDRALVYITGGFATAKVEASVTIPGTGTFTDSHTRYGWTAGAGLEYAFLNNWSLKAEYLYVRLEDQAYLFSGTPVVPRGGVPLDNHIARVGLNWRFTECAYGSCGGPVVAKY
jgi:outer membrane immunogenic protein